MAEGTTIDLAPVNAVAGPPRLPASIRGLVIAGSCIVLAFFGLFGGWAALSPLDGAVVGEGIVTVEGNRKSVEHLEGGTVKEIDVREDDHVAVGDVLDIPQNLGVGGVALAPRPLLLEFAIPAVRVGHALDVAA